MFATLLMIALAGPVAPGELEVDTIVPDRFEAHELELFRIDRLALRDPHLFVEVEVFGFPVCVDATDPNDDFDAPSFNGIVDATLNEDGSGDGNLDESPLLVFQPRGWPGGSGALALGDGECTAPAETTTCSLVDTGPRGWFDNRDDAGLCRGALPDTPSDQNYQPPIPEIEAPCFATHPAPVSIDLADLALELAGASVSGSWTQLAGERIDPGQLRGFLSEADAEAIIIPEDIDIIGGQPLASLLPGGDGNCAAHDDRDEFGGETGWWFYFDVGAERPAGTRDW